MGVIVAVLLIVMALFGAPLFAVLGGMGISNFSGAGTDLVVLSEEHYKLATNPVPHHDSAVHPGRAS